MDPLALIIASIHQFKDTRNILNNKERLFTVVSNSNSPHNIKLKSNKNQKTVMGWNNSMDREKLTRRSGHCKIGETSWETEFLMTIAQKDTISTNYIILLLLLYYISWNIIILLLLYYISWNIIKSLLLYYISWNIIILLSLYYISWNIIILLSLYYIRMARVCYLCKRENG